MDCIWASWESAELSLGCCLLSVVDNVEISSSWFIVVVVVVVVVIGIIIKMKYTTFKCSDYDNRTKNIYIVECCSQVNELKLKYHRRRNVKFGKIFSFIKVVQLEINLKYMWLRFWTFIIIIHSVVCRASHSLRSFSRFSLDKQCLELMIVKFLILTLLQPWLFLAAAVVISKRLKKKSLCSPPPCLCWCPKVSHRSQEKNILFCYSFSFSTFLSSSFRCSLSFSLVRLDVDQCFIMWTSTRF